MSEGTARKSAESMPWGRMEAHRPGAGRRSILSAPAGTNKPKTIRSLETTSERKIGFPRRRIVVNVCHTIPLSGGRMAAVRYALSLKQPWAALLVHGRKTIEVRRWPTARRERILIHAAREPDERPEAWGLVPPELREAADLRGGIVGAGDLTDCKIYQNRQAFAADGTAHLNDPSWFDGRRLYGFVFVNLTVLPFRPYPGWMRFFPVDEMEGDSSTPGREGRGPYSSLMVSVRSAEEVEPALAGGAALIDIKEPARGALGPASIETI